MGVNRFLGDSLTLPEWIRPREIQTSISRFFRESANTFLSSYIVQFFEKALNF